jgi:3',5'-cyclic AMP phosphodiesterase CpdA
MNPFGLVSRRAFLKTAASVPLLLAWDLHGRQNVARRLVRFGLCADPHKDVMHDADQRLRTFVDAANQAKAEFLLQLGDFCRPYEKNRGFLKIWDSFAGPRYHTLGNHDRDGGFSWQKVQDFWGLERRYYSFDHGGWHFVVLDGNEKKPVKPAPGYPRYIGAEQLAWLEEDLRKTSAPTLTFSHQSLADPEGLENGAAVRQVLERANKEAGWPKVGASLSGHHHIDFACEINGVHYVQVNSMSYSWLGDKYAHVRYSAEVDKAFPSVKYTAPYKDPLFAFATLDPQGWISIQGVRSEFVGPSPWELGVPDKKGTAQAKNCLVPRISDRKLTLRTAPKP